MSLREKVIHTGVLWEWCGVVPYMGRVEVKVFKCIVGLPWLATALFIPCGKPASRAPLAIEREPSYTLDEVCQDFEEELLRHIPELRGALEAPEGCI